MRKRLFPRLASVLIMSTMIITSTFASEMKTVYHYENDAGTVDTVFKDLDSVKVSYFIDETKCLNISDPTVEIRDADEIIPTSANVSKTLNLAVGKSYTYGEFYMGSNGPGDPHEGDMIDVTVNGISSGKYKVIVKGIKYGGFMGLDKEEVYSFESNEYSTAKTFSLPGEGGVAYSVTILNTSAQNLKANLSIVTYQS